MNSVIESLNLWGERFLQFAWPMLWQSSVLIAVLFALDLALRRKVRASVRYALWLVVMVKLLLPPTLAVPTSIAWWVLPNPPTKPQPQEYIVTHINHAQTPTTPNLYEAFNAGALEIPQSKLSAAGWFVTASGVISFSLLVWMMLRWRHVARMVRTASPAAQDWNTMLSECQRRIVLRRAVRLRMTDLPMSPAVCGLFRPVILLPRSLAEQLPSSQLRAVLLHELVHLKRGDVWVNCAQALLQIAYWWHPLLWLANARIRRVREEAVDDAVMLALHDEAETYAPTLLEVAKLALNRPLASLGLVGIMESRSALRQRIERLTNFSAPRKAGLTALSALGVIVFSALAVPMEKAPVTIAADVSSQVSSGSQHIPPASQVSASFVGTATNAASLVESGKLLFEMGKLDEAEARLKEAVAIDTENQRAHYYLDQIKQARNSKSERQSSRTTGRQEIVKKLHRIRLDRIFYDAVPLEEVIRGLHQETKERDPDGRGVNFILNPNSGQPSVNAIDPATGLPVAKTHVTAPDFQWPQIKINPALTNITLGDVLDVIVEVADKPIRYSIEDFGVVFSVGRASEPLYMREFKLDSQAFGKWLQYAAVVAHAEQKNRASFDDLGLILPSVNPREMVSPALSPSVQADLPQRPERGGVDVLTRTDDLEITHASVRSLFSGNGVDLSPPKSVFYGDRKGILLVNATLSDLDAIERLVEKWNTSSPPAIVHSDKAPLLGDLPWLGKLFRSGSNSNRVATNGGTWLAELTNILTDAASAQLADQLSRSESNSPPSSTTNSGQLLVRRFKVNPNTFRQGLESITPFPVTPTNASATARDFFGRLGVELNPPKSIFFNDRAGELLVRATLRDLETIETAIQVLNTPAQQVNIKVQFVEIPVAEIRSLGFDWYPSNTKTQFTGILTAAQFRSALHTLENRAGVDILSGPQVITVSGRQAQIQTVDMLTVVNGINPQALIPPGITSTNSATNSVYLTETIPCGPVLDVIPTVEADGRTISMTVIPTVTEFLGYDKPASANKVPVYINGKKEWVTATPLPKFRTRQITTSARVRDGQTLVLGGFTTSDTVRVKDKTPVLGDLPGVGSLFRSESRRTEKKNLIVFVTPTVIDQGGNLIHADDGPPKPK